MGKTENTGSVKIISYKKTDDSLLTTLKSGNSKGEKHNTSTLKKDRNDVIQSNTNSLKYNTLPSSSSIAQKDGNDTVSLTEKNTSLIKNFKKKVTSSIRFKKKYNTSTNSISIDEKSSVKNAHITVDQSEVNGKKPKPPSSINSNCRSDHKHNILIENYEKQTNGNNTLPIQGGLFKIDKHKKITIPPLTCVDNNGNSSNKKESKRPQPKPSTSLTNNKQSLYKTNFSSNFTAYDGVGLNQPTLKKNNRQSNSDSLEWPDSTSNLKKSKSSDNKNSQLAIMDNTAPSKPLRAFTTNNQFNSSIEDSPLLSKSDNSLRISSSEEEIPSDSQNKNLDVNKPPQSKFQNEVDSIAKDIDSIKKQLDRDLAKIDNDSSNNQDFNTSGNKDFNHKNKGNNMDQQTTNNEQNMTSKHSTEEDEKREKIQPTNPFGECSPDSESEISEIENRSDQTSTTKKQSNSSSDNKLKRSAFADTIYDPPWNSEKTMKNIPKKFLESQSNIIHTTSTTGSITPLTSSEKINRFWPRVKYAMHQKGFVFFSATALALCSSMALVYFQNREKLIALIINMPNYLTIPFIALASLITISVMIFIIKQFKNTEEHQIKKGDDHKILNATLDHQKESKIIKSVKLKYSNNTISEFMLNVWKSNDGFVDIDEKAITRTGKVESLINNRPLFTFLFTNFIAANVALPSALYAIGGVSNVKAFYAVLPTTYIGLSIIVASSVLALSILYLGSHYYSKTNCTNLLCTQDNIDPKTINDKIIDAIKEKRTNVLEPNHEKEAKSYSLELEQVVVQSHNAKDMIYNILN